MRACQFFANFISDDVQHPFDHSFGGCELLFGSHIRRMFHFIFLIAAGDSNNCAQIGISVEALDQLQSQTPAANTSVSTVESFVQFSTKMVENLFNYVSSFAVTQAQMVPNPSETFVPLSSLHSWYSSFKRKLEFDPNFWKN